MSGHVLSYFRDDPQSSSHLVVRATVQTQATIAEQVRLEKIRQLRKDVAVQPVLLAIDEAEIHQPLGRGGRSARVWYHSLVTVHTTSEQKTLEVLFTRP